MKTKTAELMGTALDWAVAKCEIQIQPQRYLDPSQFIALHDENRFNYSSLWAQGGPIIEREKSGVWAYTLDENGDENPGWYAETFEGYVSNGPTPLIAAMRCYVTSKLGDEVEVPDGF